MSQSNKISAHVWVCVCVFVVVFFVFHCHITLQFPGTWRDEIWPDNWTAVTQVCSCLSCMHILFFEFFPAFCFIWRRLEVFPAFRSRLSTLNLNWTLQVVRGSVVSLISSLTVYQNSRRFPSQLEAKQVVAYLHGFSRAFRRLQRYPANCDWFFALVTSVVIG